MTVMQAPGRIMQNKVQQLPVSTSYQRALVWKEEWKKLECHESRMNECNSVHHQILSVSDFSREDPWSGLSKDPRSQSPRWCEWLTGPPTHGMWVSSKNHDRENEPQYWDTNRGGPNECTNVFVFSFLLLLIPLGSSPLTGGKETISVCFFLSLHFFATLSWTADQRMSL